MARPRPSLGCWSSRSARNWSPPWPPRRWRPRLDLSGPALPAGLALIELAVSPVRWEEWLTLNRLGLPAAAPRPSFDRAAMAIAAAAQGVGVALESTRLAAGELARGELVVLGGESVPRPAAGAAPSLQEGGAARRAAGRGLPGLAAGRS